MSRSEALDNIYWTLGILSGFFTTLVGAVWAKTGKVEARINQHDVRFETVVAQVGESVRTLVQQHAEREEQKFDEKFDKIVTRFDCVDSKLTDLTIAIGVVKKSLDGSNR